MLLTKISSSATGDLNPIKSLQEKGSTLFRVQKDIVAPEENLCLFQASALHSWFAQEHVLRCHKRELTLRRWSINVRGHSHVYQIWRHYSHLCSKSSRGQQGYCLMSATGGVAIDPQSLPFNFSQQISKHIFLHLYIRSERGLDDLELFSQIFWRYSRQTESRCYANVKVTILVGQKRFFLSMPTAKPELFKPHGISGWKILRLFCDFQRI